MRTFRQCKFIVVASLAVLFGLVAWAPAWASTFNHLSISSDITGGATTAPTSGVSLMYVNQSSTRYISAVNDGPFRTAQVKEIDYSQVQQAAGGTVAGTFDLWLVQSLDPNDFASGETVYLYKDEALTGLTNNAVGPVTVRVKPGMFLQYYFGTSGATGFDKAHIIERGGEANDGFDVSPPLILDEDYSAFTTTGTTQFYSGTTAIPVAAGVKWIEVQPNGDDIYYTTDGSTAPSSSTTILEDGEMILFRPYEWERFWMSAGGNAAGVLSIRQWSSDPK